PRSRSLAPLDERLSFRRRPAHGPSDWRHQRAQRVSDGSTDGQQLLARDNLSSLRHRYEPALARSGRAANSYFAIGRTGCRIVVVSGAIELSNRSTCSMAVVGDFCYCVIEGSSKNVGILPMHTTIQSFVDAALQFSETDRLEIAHRLL